MNISLVMLIVGVIALSGCSLFTITDCDSSLGDCNISGNEGTPEVTQEAHALPEGYTLDSYAVEEVTDTACEQDADCETPMEYIIQSRCPFTSLCLENLCTVVCPDVQTKEVQGEITSAKQEMDGWILTVRDGEDLYEVLVSIPNLGEAYASSIEQIEVGRYIQVAGIVLRFKGSERIIASQIYVEGALAGEHPCNLDPDPGQCEAAMPRYYFDQEEQRCKEFLWGGCDGTVPFDSLEVCRSTCERTIPDKPDLTRSSCESDGGRVVNGSEEDCGQDELPIGSLQEDADLICCMTTGGSATSGA